MEKSEVNIHKIKNEILNKKLRIQSLNFKINNEYNEYSIQALSKELKTEAILLADLNAKLNEEVNNDKREKAYYKKYLNKVKDSLTEFARISKANGKLKKHSQDMSNVILLMEKYLNT